MYEYLMSSRLSAKRGFRVAVPPGNEAVKMAKAMFLKQSRNGPVKAICCGPVIVLRLYWKVWAYVSTALLT